MDDSFDTALDFTLAEEGGFIAHASDPRFTANHGITLARLRRFQRDPSLGTDAVAHIPCATVRALYLADFWNRTRCDALPPGIDLMVFDHAVSAGPDRSGRALQRAIGFQRDAIDGAIGPRAIARAAASGGSDLLDSLTAAQRGSYRQMAAFGLFGDGWLARLDRRRAKAMDLLTLDQPLSRR